MTTVEELQKLEERSYKEGWQAALVAVRGRMPEDLPWWSKKFSNPIEAYGDFRAEIIKVIEALKK